MKKISFIIALAVFILGGALSLWAADIQSVEIINYGIYKAEILRQEDAAKAAAGYKTVSTNPVYRQKTDKIAATLGMSFGFEYIIHGTGADLVDLTVKYLHPPITNPKTGKVFASQEIVSHNRRIGKTNNIGYRFGDSWEIVPGTWTIQLFYGDNKVAEKIFYISKP
jgi:hypothetical protein